MSLLDNAISTVQNLTTGQKVLFGTATAVTAVGATALAVASKRKSTTRRKKSSSKKRKKSYKYARTAGKGKDRSTKRIRMTKTGQPYIILKSGKARFIKKSSARASRKRKGGRY